MGKVIMFNLISLDGFFEGGKKWDLGWHHVDAEFNQFAIDQLDKADGLIFGRVTYEGMAAYWSTEGAIKDDPEVARRMNSIQKFVFSRTLEKAEWNNTRLIKTDAVTELKRLKQSASKDLYIFGSANLAATFTKEGLIDEYRLMVNPVVLGQGTSVFDGNHATLELKLLNSRTFKNGNVLLYYEPNVK